MVCMEVWGGCDPINTAVTMSGLDAWVYSKPYCEPAGTAPEGGGDVYYVSSCATGRINRLLVADVSGHGAAVRNVAVHLRDLMRRYVNYLDQSTFVAAMNKRFVETSAAGIFATAVVTTFFAPTRTLSVCNAGHPPPLLYRQSEKTWSLLDPESDGHRSANIPLGILDLQDYEQFTVTLDAGDLLLIYTDSLMEARDATGEIIGTQGLLNITQSANLNPTEPLTLVPNLLTAIESQTGATLHKDDITCLLLRPNGQGTKVTWRDSIAAPFRIARGLLKSLITLKRPPLPDLHPANVAGVMIPSLQRKWGKSE